MMKKRTSDAVVGLCLSAVMLFFALISCQTDTPPADKTPPAVTDPVVGQDEVISVNTDGRIDFSGFADGTNAETFSSDHIFTFREVSLLSENISSVYHNYHAHTDGTLFTDALLEHDGERERVIIKIAPDMTASTIPIPNDIPNLGWGESFGDFYVRDDGSMLISTYAVNIPIPGVMENPDFQGHLYHYSADGEMLASATLDTGSQDIGLLPDGRVVVLEDGALHIFDEQLQLLCSLSGAGTPLISPKGELFVQSGYHGSYAPIDTETYAFLANTVYAPQNTAPSKTMYFSYTQTAYDAYFSDDVGFRGMLSGETEATLLCSWQDSGMASGDVFIDAVIDENTFFGRLNDPFSDEGQVTGIFRKSEKTESGKRLITLGAVDNIKFRVSNLTLIDAVNRFNATNEDYFVDIVRYAGTGDDCQHGEIPDAFTEAMLSDTAADIIVSSDRARENMQTYREKGAFVDLSSAVSEVLIPAAYHAFLQDNGKLYALPMSMKLSVIAAGEHILPADAVLSLEHILSLDSMAREQGIQLTNSPSPDILSAIAAPSFADFETGECRYQSEAFASYLQFFEAYRMADSEKDSPFSHEGNLYYIGSPDFPDALRNDACLLLETPLCSPDAYAILKLFNEDRAFSLHGYPADGKEIVYMQSELDFSISATSDVQYGAMLFLAFLLSDDIQQSASLTDISLPVTYSGCESLLERRTYYFNQNLLADDDYYLGCRIERTPDQHVEYLMRYEGDDALEQLLTVTLTDDDIAALRRLFYTSETRSLVDTTMTRIIEEELSAYRAGAQTLERTQEILQSRLFIYINE